MSDPFDFDDFDSFDDLDKMLGDFGDPFKKDDRKPIYRARDAALAEFKSKKGLLKAAGRVGYNALPSGYRAAWRQAERTYDSATDVYDSVLKEFEGTGEDIKKLGRLGTPVVDKLLPKKIAKRYKEMVAKGEGDRYRDQQADDVNALLTEVFGEQMRQDAMGRQETRLENAKRDVREDKRFKQSLTVTVGMAKDIARVRSIQETIGIRYQMKSLELQHKQHYTLNELLQFQKASQQDIVTNLKAITHNTALSDSVKLMADQKASGALREMLYGKVRQSTHEQMNRLGERIRKGLQQRVQETASQVVSMVTMASDMVNEDEDAMMDPAAEAGRQGAEAVRDAAATWLGRKLRKRVKTSDKMMAGSSMLRYFMNQGNRLLNTGMRDESNEFMRSLSWLIGGPVEADQERVVHNLYKEGDKQVPWDMLSRRTLIEVIPGYLSRQLEQLTNIATGTKNDRIVYSVEREQFVSKGQAKKDLQRRVDIQMNTAVRSDAMALISHIDRKGELSQKARTDFAMMLVKDSNAGRAFDPTRYADKGMIDSPYASDIASVVTDYYSLQDVGEDEDDDALMRTPWETTKDLFKDPKKFRDMMTGGAQYGKRMDVTRESAQRLEETARLFGNLSYGVGRLDAIAGEYKGTGQAEIARDLGLFGKQRGMFTDIMNKDYKWQQIRQQMETGGVSEGGGNFTERTPGPGGRPIGPTPTGGGGPSAPGAMSWNQALDRQNEMMESITDEYRGRSTESLDLMRQQISVNEDGFSSVVEAIEKGIVLNKTEIVDAKSMKEFLSMLRDRTGAGAKSAKAKGSRLKRAAGAYARLIGSQFRFGGKMLRGGAGIAGKITGGILGSVAGGLRNMTKKSADVYVRGKDRVPALRATDMRAGLYVDSEGNRITSISDIGENEIYDSDGNVVVSKADLAAGLYTPDSRLNRMLKGIGGGLISIWKKEFDIAKFVFNKARGAIKGAGRALTPVKDVYVQGETEPRLYAHKMRSGAYVSKRSGNLVAHQHDIDGPVMDENGNIILEDHEVPHLVDVQGNGIEPKGLIGTAMGMIGSSARLAGRAAAGAVKLGIASGKFAGRMVGGAWRALTGKGGSGKGGDGSMYSDPNTYLLEKIYNHLRSKWPLTEADEKIRDTFARGHDKFESAREKAGETFSSMKETLTDMYRHQLDPEGVGPGADKGWRAVLRKRREKRAAEKERKEAREEGRTVGKVGKGGLLGLLAGGAGGLLSKLTGKDRKTGLPFLDKDGDDDEGGFGIKDLLMASGGTYALTKAKGLWQGTKNLAGKLVPGKMKDKMAKKAAEKAAKKAGKRGLGRLAMTAGRQAAWQGVRMAGMAAGSMLSLPVLLGVGAVALGAYGAYKAYKAIAVRKDLTPLEKFRMYQYGIQADHQKDRVVHMRLLEKAVEKKVKVTPGGIKMDVPPNIALALMEDITGLNPDDPVKSKDAIHWFYKRFLRVYGAHRVATDINTKVSFEEVDEKLSPTAIPDYMSYVRFRDEGEKNIWKVRHGPYPEPLVDVRYQANELAGKIIKAASKGQKIEIEDAETSWLGSLADSWFGGDAEEPKEKPKPTGRDENLVERNAGQRRPKRPKINYAAFGLEDPMSGINNLLVPTEGRISSEFGTRNDPISLKKADHKGVDIAAPEGTPVKASDRGVILRAQFSSSYGNVVYINHPNGTQTRYAHMAGFAGPHIKAGYEVQRGELIGFVGSTGKSTGPHLHWELRKAIPDDLADQIATRKRDWGFENERPVMNPLAFVKGGKKPTGIPFDPTQADPESDQSGEYAALDQRTNYVTAGPKPNQVSAANRPAGNTGKPAAGSEAAGMGPFEGMADLRPLVETTGRYGDQSIKAMQQQADLLMQMNAQLATMVQILGKERNLSDTEVQQMVNGMLAAQPKPQEKVDLPVNLNKKRA